MPQIVTIDLETFYSREFSLTKLATEQYVRSPQFETIGIAIGIGDEPPVWYPKPDVAYALDAIDWSNKLVLAQNTAFDASILAWHYNINPLAWLDTLGMSRALFPHAKSHSLKAQAERQGVGVKGDEVINALGKNYSDFTPQELARYGEYCVNDALLTKRLFDTYMGMGFPKIELKLIDLTLRMFVEPGLILDKPKLQLHLTEVREAKAQLLDEVRDMMLAEGDPDYIQEVFSEGTDGIKKLLMSNEKFATLLRKYGAEPPMKISPATKKEAYAFAKTDEAFIALGEHHDVHVQGLVAARLGNKTTIEETRTERFIGMADRGAFPVPLRYYGAHSGRWSGCLVADTQVLVYDLVQGVAHKRLVDVLVDDLVWDGLEFVTHEGVQFSGYQEVITWDTITGTEDHVVFTDAGEISLRDAMQGAHCIQTARGPSEDAVDAARRLTNHYQE